MATIKATSGFRPVDRRARGPIAGPHHLPPRVGLSKNSAGFVRSLIAIYTK
jgi:hypothetical protein